MKDTESPNFESAKIPIKSRWDIDHMRRHLRLLRPNGGDITDSENFERQLVKNRSGARVFLDQID